MDVISLILFLLIGLAAGWLAGQIMKGRGFGLVGNMIVGVVGAFLGGFLFRIIGFVHVGGLLGTLLMAVVGAVVLVFVVGLIKKA